MQVVQFKTKYHYVDLAEILTARRHHVPSPSDIPSVGFVAYDDRYERVVAMAFVRRCEGDTLALIDGLVSNPESGPADRNEGLDLVVLASLAWSKEHNIKQILAFTTDASVLVRSERLGFVKHSTHSVMSFDLKRKAQ